MWQEQMEETQIQPSQAGAFEEDLSLIDFTLMNIHNVL